VGEIGCARLTISRLGRNFAKINRGESAIGIVFTSHAVKTTFETELRALDVPFVSVRGSGFWSSEAATLTLHLLQILLDGSDRVAFVGLARSALGGLSDVALFGVALALEADEERAVGACCTDIPDFLPSREDDARAFALLASRLDEWRDLARVAPFSEFWKRFFSNRSWLFTKRACPMARRASKLAQSCRFGARARSEWAGRLALAHRRIGALVEEAQNGDKEAEAPLPGLASIQLMTVWAAKGLGFPLTVLAQLDDTPRARPVRCCCAGSSMASARWPFASVTMPKMKKRPNPGCGRNFARQIWPKKKRNGAAFLCRLHARRIAPDAALSRTRGARRGGVDQSVSKRVGRNDRNSARSEHSAHRETGQNRRNRDARESRASPRTRRQPGNRAQRNRGRPR
jgi:hypothetical protein